jgi:hypothetical protein
MSDEQTKTAWGTWEVLGPNQYLDDPGKFSIVLSSGPGVAPRRKSTETWPEVAEALAQVDPDTVGHVSIFPPRPGPTPPGGEYSHSWPRKTPPDVWQLARLNLALDHLLHLHSVSNFREDNERLPTGDSPGYGGAGRDVRVCAVCRDEVYPCFTVREVQAARGYVWDATGPFGEWRPMTEQELTLSLNNAASAGSLDTRRYWTENIGDVPIGYYNKVQTERRKRRPGSSVDTAPRTETTYGNQT